MGVNISDFKSIAAAIRKSGVIAFCLLLSFAITAPASYAQQAAVAPAAQKNGIQLADPTIFFQDGTYYLYGTVEGNTNEGFQVYTSPDLKAWAGPKGAQDGFALKKGEAFGSKGFWAPQVFYHEGKFYMAYTADEGIAVAVSDSPLGPFTQAVKQPLAAPVKQIDPFIFIDEDGKKYLYHVRLQEGNRIFVAEMSDDFSAIKEETLQECIAAQESWENTAQAEWPVAEGPTIIKRNNLYYMIYSANDFRNPDYAVGYATSTSPLGPWVKQKESPILSKADTGINGTGHGDLFTDRNGDFYYVFHTHYSNTKVAPRRTALVKAMFTGDGISGRQRFVLDSKSLQYLKQGIRK